MKHIVSCNQMKAIDAYTIQNMGIPSCVLMERAALAVVNEIEAFEKNLEGRFENSVDNFYGFHKGDNRRKILVVCGSGNNGGDGIAIARILKLHGYCVHVYLAGNVEKMTEETKQQYQIALNYQVSFVNNIQWNEYTTIVDAIFGVGLAREIQGSYRELIEQMNAATAYKVAVDIPSGINGDTGAVLGVAFKADVTVTFAYTKYGICLYPGRSYAGRVVTADIGIYMPEINMPEMNMPKINMSKINMSEPINEDFLFSNDEHDSKDCDLYSISPNYAGHYLERFDLKSLPDRNANGNKGTFGKVLIVAGSKGMCGAAYLSASGAIAGGAGMVKIVTPEENRLPLQTLLPEAMISCDFSEEESQKNMNWCDILVIGPGIGTSAEASEHVLWYLKKSKEFGKTVILDADGLNLLAFNPSWKEFLPERIIFTPHLGEMSRLCGKSIGEIQADPVACAEDYVNDFHGVCVMKDACTVIADASGKVYLNLSGNAGMATAGSGDVLSGLIAAVCCMYLPTLKNLSGEKNFSDDKDLSTEKENDRKTLNESLGSAKISHVSLCDMAALGVMLHGCAGDKAAEKNGMHSMKAGDIVDGVSDVLQC